MMSDTMAVDPRFCRPGMLVAIDGLKNRADLNRQYGTVTSTWNEKTGRVGVAVHVESVVPLTEPVALKPENITPIEISFLFGAHLNDHRDLTRLMRALASIKQQYCAKELIPRVYISVSIGKGLENNVELVQAVDDLSNDDPSFVVLSPPREEDDVAAAVDGEDGTITDENDEEKIKYKHLSQYQHLARIAQSAEYLKYRDLANHWLFFHDHDDLSGPLKLEQFLTQMKVAYELENYGRDSRGKTAQKDTSWTGAARNLVKSDGDWVGILSGHSLAVLDERILAKGPKNQPSVNITDRTMNHMKKQIEDGLGYDFIEPNGVGDVTRMMDRGMVKVIRDAKPSTKLGQRGEVFEVAFRVQLFTEFLSSIIGKEQKPAADADSTTLVDKKEKLLPLKDRKDSERELIDSMLLRSNFTDLAFYHYLDTVRNLPRSQKPYVAFHTLHLKPVDDDHFFLHFSRLRPVAADDYTDDLLEQDLAEEADFLASDKYFKYLASLQGSSFSTEDLIAYFTEFRRATETGLFQKYGYAKVVEPLKLLDTFSQWRTKDCKAISLSSKQREELAMLMKEVLSAKNGVKELLLEDDPMIDEKSAEGSKDEKSVEDDEECVEAAKSKLSKELQDILNEPSNSTDRALVINQYFRALHPYLAAQFCTRMNIPFVDAEKVEEYTKNRMLDFHLVHRVRALSGAHTKHAHGA